jgi:hypothetical protein
MACSGATLSKSGDGFRRREVATMKRISLLLALVLVASLVRSASAAPDPKAKAAPAAASEGMHRVNLPQLSEKVPYSVEIPWGWQVHEANKDGVAWLGPASLTNPETDSSVVYVRLSPVALSDPAKVVEMIKKNAAAPDASFKAALVEVREVGGVRGVLVQMDQGSGATATSTLFLKMPLTTTSVDFIARAASADFASHRAGYERILFSLRRVD